MLRATEFEQDCYAEAITICFDQKRFASAWNWIQRNKARILSDMLRVGVVIPEYLRVKIEGTEEMAQLLCEETSLVRRLDNTSGEYSLGLRYELGMLRNRMRQFPLLAELLASRDGNSETLEDLDWLFKNDPMSEKIRVVDWMYVNNKIYIVIVGNERNPEMEEVQNEVDLNDWVHEYIFDEDKSGG